MAVARMLKVTVFGHNCVLESVVDSLQQAGVIEIEAAELDDHDLPAISANEARLNSVDERVAGAQFVATFLSRFRTPEVAFGAFVSEKIHLSDSEYRGLLADETYAAVLRECTHISDRLGAIDRDTTALIALIDELEPWKALRLQISQWKGTEHIALFTGTVPISAGPEIRQLLRDTCDEVTVA